MSENVLEKIINTKINRISELKKDLSVQSIEAKIKTNNSYINFKEKIEDKTKEN